jgi:hypothetical protein
MAEALQTVCCFLPKRKPYLLLRSSLLWQKSSVKRIARSLSGHPEKFLLLSGKRAAMEGMAALPFEKFLIH